jgi:putative ABC transport system permease protein
MLAAHHLTTVCLGSAAVTAVVSIMLAVAFQPLPFRDATQLVEIWNRIESGPPIGALTGAELEELQRETTVFAATGGFHLLSLWLLHDRGGPEPLRVARLDEASFRLLDLAPLLGRGIGGSAGAGGIPPVWISDALWRFRYGGRSSVVGETMRVGQNSAGLYEARYEIAGVLPSEIRMPHPTHDDAVDVWMILPETIKQRAANASVFFAVGRLQPGRTAAEAQAALTVSADRRPRSLDRRNRPVVHSLQEVARGPAQRTMMLLALGVALVLLLAFANLASVTAAELNTRQVELSVRMALGASRWRLWRESIAEQSALTVCGLVVGVPLAWLALRGLTRLVTLSEIAPPVPHPPALNVSIMLGFSACVLIAAVAWSAVTVWRLADGRSESVLRARQGITGLPSDRRAGVWRFALLSVQACLGIGLMVLAMSLTRAYVRLSDVDLGPAPDRTLVLSVIPREGGVMTHAQAADFNAETIARVRRVPGVHATAFADSFPPFGLPTPFWKRDDLVDAPREATYPLAVSNDYFATLGIPILFGRAFAESDRWGQNPVALVDLELARRNWTSPSEAVNAQIKVGTAMRPYTIVGVAKSFGGYWAHAPVPTIYLSQNQQPSAGGTVILRTSGAPSAAAEHARQVLSTMPVRPEISNAGTLQALWQATVTRPRARMVGTLLLGLIGLLLGAQGVYALAASVVTSRRQELAIRSALGATGPTLLWMVLRQVVVAVVLGAGVGAFGIIAVERLAPQWISATLSDPAAPIGWATVLLVSTAIVGSYIPARLVVRATSIAQLARN